MPAPSVDPIARAVLAAVRAGSDDEGHVAAVSGGADSVALAWALRSLGRLAKVVFVDHGLRDVTAERDAAEASAVGVPFEVRRVTVPAGNLQAQARKARYRALLAEPGRVATGHTLSDQAETVLARMLRGSGVPGLSGLAPRKGRVVRPLLAVSRAETRALGLMFVDDPSNATGRYQRNRLRALLERLGREQPRIERALAELATSARASTELLDALVTVAPDLSFTGLAPALAQTFLVHRARVADGSPQRAPLMTLAAAMSAGGVSAVTLGDELVGRAAEGRVALARRPDPRTMVVAWGPGTYRASAMELTLTEIPAPVPAFEDDAAITACVAATGLAWPLKLRRARRAEAGVFGDGIDFDTGAGLGGWRVEDASGRTLVPDASGSARDGDRWIRIDLKRSPAPRDTVVVASSVRPLSTD